MPGIRPWAKPMADGQGEAAWGVKGPSVRYFWEYTDSLKDYSLVLP
jgi:hypothetical protein